MLPNLIFAFLTLQPGNPFYGRSYLQEQNPINQKPYITVHLSGQLGNQLFEISAALAHAWDNDLELIVPELRTRSDCNIPLNFRKIFFRLNASHLPRPNTGTFTQNNIYEYVPIPLQHDLKLEGYYQTWKYFHHHREKILDIFAPHPKHLEILQNKHAMLLNHPYTVGVHVRTFNKQWSGTIPFVGLAYYEKAISHFPPEALFVVFSDRIDWCKAHFLKFNRPMVFIERQDHVDDLYLMSMLKHNIIGNSTFSWWAAYLNRNPDKIVVAPSHFIHPAFTSSVNSIMPGWIKIDIDWGYRLHPYPADIERYRTTSVDN